MVRGSNARRLLGFASAGECEWKTYLAGTLSAGPDVNEDNSAQVCRASNLIASYGRFSAALPFLETYLKSVTGVSPGTSAPSITATPLTPSGRTTLMWQASGPTQVQVRVGSPDRPGHDWV